jgi:hypothetical protein
MLYFYFLKKIICAKVKFNSSEKAKFRYKVLAPKQMVENPLKSAGDSGGRKHPVVY